jgi:regulator of sigma E protease
MPQIGDVHKMSEMPEEKTHSRITLKNLVLMLILAAVLAFVIRKPDTALYVLLVMLGFGAVIMIHEFGHFIVAKLSGIKVEAFSIGFPPTLIAIQKIKGRIHTRLLPKAPSVETKNDNDKQTEDTPAPKTNNNARPNKNADTWDTEYRIGMIPFGGFVKMLGQVDTGAAEKTDDPRSYANKPISIRIAVVAAGVIFNVLSAILIFMTIFLVGKNLVPPVVGNVIPDSPAHIAGLRPKDKIIEVDGEKFVDYSNLLLAAALAEKGQGVSVLVEHPNGTKEPFFIIPEEPIYSTMGLRKFGLSQAETLTIERKITRPEDMKLLHEKTGLKPADVIKAANHIPVNDAWQFREIIENSLLSQATLTLERTDPKTKQKSSIDVELPLVWTYNNPNFRTHFDLAHVYSMIPRLKVVGIPEESLFIKWKKNIIAWIEKLVALFRKDSKPAPKDSEKKPHLQVGDIILKVAQLENPTYQQLREVTTEYEDKNLSITVLRTDQDGNETLIVIIVQPKKQLGTDHVALGIYPGLDVEHPVVAQTIDIKDGPIALNIPSGATIERVDGYKVDSFYDIARIIRKNKGQRISIDYRLDEQNAGSVTLNTPKNNDYITAKTTFAVSLPLEVLKKEYKAKNPLQAVQMGLKRTWLFIQQTLLTLKRLISQDVSPKALTGPVGIVSMSYKLASQNIPDYIYFLGLISSIIAVMNLLPIPIVDGGVIVMLIIEKIKGSPISPKVQELVSYVGLAFIIAIFLWITYQDIINQLITR